MKRAWQQVVAAQVRVHSWQQLGDHLKSTAARGSTHLAADRRGAGAGAAQAPPLCSATEPQRRPRHARHDRPASQVRAGEAREALWGCWAAAEQQRRVRSMQPHAASGLVLRHHGAAEEGTSAVSLLLSPPHLGCCRNVRPIQVGGEQEVQRAGVQIHCGAPRCSGARCSLQRRQRWRWRRRGGETRCSAGTLRSPPTTHACT